MKCKNCNTVLKQGAKFCPNCGKEVSDFDICISCGKQIKPGAAFCPHCGKNQNDVVVEPEQVNEVQPQEPEIVQEDPVATPAVVEQPQEHEDKKVESEPPSSSVQEEMIDTIQPYESKPTSKKWLWIIGTIIFLGILGGGGYYFMNNKGENLSYVDYVETDSIAEIGDSIIVAGEDIEVTEAVLQKIFSALITDDGDRYLPEYFTEGFNTYYKRACEKAMKEHFESPRIWWQESDSDPSQFIINAVTPISDNEVKSDVTLKSEISKCDFEVIVKKENGNWLIDKITQKEEYQQVDKEAAIMDAMAAKNSAMEEMMNEEMTDMSSDKDESLKSDNEAKIDNVVYGFNAVDEFPQFPGGSSAMFEYISKNLRYPVAAEENGIQGNVTLTCIIERDGSISDVKVVKSIAPSLDKEAQRLVRSMPHWTPGKHNGSVVRVKCTIPVTFKLQ